VLITRDTSETVSSGMGRLTHNMLKTGEIYTGPTSLMDWCAGKRAPGRLEVMRRHYPENEDILRNINRLQLCRNMPEILEP